MPLTKRAIAAVRKQADYPLLSVLVACEFSGVVRDAFLAKGHYAVSCDLLPTEKLGPHYQGDVLDILDDGWDLMIAHPPCTYLCSAGARWMGCPMRQEKQRRALEFVRVLLNAPIHRICLENPPGVIGSNIRKADQYVQPYEFGHLERKKTGLWLKNLPLLKPTNNVYEQMMRLPIREREREFIGKYPDLIVGRRGVDSTVG